MTVEAAIARARAQLDAAAGEDAAMRALYAAAFAPAEAAARAHPGWPVLALPLAVGPALGADSALATGLAAACLLFFASADVVDDAQDGDLDPGRWPGEAGSDWRPAVTAGLGLAFAAPLAALAVTDPAHGGAVARAFAVAGAAMSAGQHRDLVQRGLPGRGVREADYMACVAGKSGASFALFASVGAHATGAAPGTASSLAAYGRALGMALQLASDIGDACREDGRDRRNGVLTLPVIRAWERLGRGDRPLLEASWRGEPDAPPLAFLLERTGALDACRARLAVLRTEAMMALDGASLPADLVATLATLATVAEPEAPGALV